MFWRHYGIPAISIQYSSRPVLVLYFFCKSINSLVENEVDRGNPMIYTHIHDNLILHNCINTMMCSSSSQLQAPFEFDNGEDITNYLTTITSILCAFTYKKFFSRNLISHGH